MPLSPFSPPSSSSYYFYYYYYYHYYYYYYYHSDQFSVLRAYVRKIYDSQELLRVSSGSRYTIARSYYE